MGVKASTLSPKLEMFVFFMNIYFYSKDLCPVVYGPPTLQVVLCLGFHSVGSNA